MVLHNENALVFVHVHAGKKKNARDIHIHISVAARKCFNIQCQEIQLRSLVIQMEVNVK